MPWIGRSVQQTLRASRHSAGLTDPQRPLALIMKSNYVVLFRYGFVSGSALLREEEFLQCQTMTYPSA
jgi:hypothetical protein